MTPFERLFTPGQVGTLQVPNRIVMPPMATSYADPDGFITDRQIAYYRERAKGGVGYITFEHTAILPQGKASGNMAQIGSDGHIPGFRKLVGAIHQEGGRVVIQINHAGRQTSSAVTGMPLVAPSPIPCPIRQEMPQELSVEEIQNLIQAYVQAAQRVKQTGADGIEIHMAHGYLMAQFLSPLANQRKDEYGGAAEKRLRVPVEVLWAVREKVGSNFPVICRISGDEYVPGGLKIEDTRKIAQALEAHGANAIHVSACVASSGYLTQPPYYVREGVFADLAAGIRSAVKIPVITVGRIRTPEFAEEILRAGKADFVAMGRALIADPHLPRKAYERKVEEIIPCISCNRCSQTGRQGNLQCAVNPHTGREDQFKMEKTLQPKKVWVIGGGPAGMKAAETAARRGHEVTLFERSQRLGGRFLLAAIPPHKQILQEYVDYLIRQLQKQPVKVLSDTEFHPAMLDEKKPDALIVATGAQAVLPSLEGIGEVKAVTGEEALGAPAQLGQRVLVVGGGGIGAEIADFLAEQGKTVTLVEMREGIALDLPTHFIYFLRKRLEEKGVQVLTQTRGLRFENGELVVDCPEGRKKISGFDSVVISLGSVPNDGVGNAVKYKVPETYVIGDAAKPREVMQAVCEGEEIAVKI